MKVAELQGGSSEAQPHRRFAHSWWGRASLDPPYTNCPQYTRMKIAEREGCFQ